MAILQQLLVNPEAKVIGFTGGRGRDHIANEFASELNRSGKNVLISHLKYDLLPTTGHIVYHDDPDELITLIEDAFKSHSTVYAGRGMNGHLVQGIQNKAVKKILEQSSVDNLLLIAGKAEKASIFPQKYLSEILKMSFLEELIYVFELDLIDEPLDEQMVENPAEFLDLFAGKERPDVLTQQLIEDYFLDTGKGARKLFRNQYTSVLVFTDVNNALLENRAINLTRNLNAPEFEHIYMANLKENLVKKVSTK